MGGFRTPAHVNPAACVDRHPKTFTIVAVPKRFCGAR
jgi:hypothetical protein